MGILPMQSPAQRASALVVDDNDDNRELFRLALEMAGFDASEASSGARALAILDNRTFDVMVLDLQMPHVNGETVLRKVRSNAKHESMRVVIATANAHMALIEVEALADYVVYKPVDLREFILLVRRLGKKPSDAGKQPTSA